MIKCVPVGKCIEGEGLDRRCIGNLVQAKYTADEKVSIVKNEVFDEGIFIQSATAIMVPRETT